MGFFKKTARESDGTVKTRIRGGRIFVCLLIVAAIVAVLASSCVTIPAGFTGIVTTFGKVEDYTLSPGFSFKSPFQKIVKMNNRNQKVSLSMQAFSSDIQQVDIVLSVNFCINQSVAQELYKTVGTEYYDTVILPRLTDNTKAVFSQYTAEALITNRETLSDEIFDVVPGDLESYGISLITVNVEDIDFTDAFTNAVEAKQVAAQNKLTAETEQARLTMEAEQAAARQVIQAEADAERAIIEANAELEVTKIQAEAALYAGEKEAEANKRIAASLTPELLTYYLYKQWNGQLPQFMGSTESYPVLNFAQ